MPYYRRRYGEGGTFAFTVCLADRTAATLTDEIDTVRAAYAATARARPFETIALCVLPDHLHAVWRLPDGDANYPGRWQGFKRRVTNALGRPIWQARCWETAIRDDRHLATLVNYVRFNPVKHGHARHMGSLAGECVDSRFA